MDIYSNEEILNILNKIKNNIIIVIELIKTKIYSFLGWNLLPSNHTLQMEKKYSFYMLSNGDL